DAARTSPYEYYQYWINVDDRDVGRFLRLFTLVAMEEIQDLERLEGAEVRRAKQRLALEATALAHGREEAEKAQAAARALFGGAAPGAEAACPSRAVPRAELERGLGVLQAFADSGLCESRNAARRLAAQGGLYVNGLPVGEDRRLTLEDLKDGAILLRAGKKKHLRLVVA
ncbi:MAG: tyrosine--tRNA ligase, partial [Planctomycetes bacterium]|nr:tyrosine--tRNA ligase [Planctomycetota bacterium]